MAPSTFHHTERYPSCGRKDIDIGHVSCLEVELSPPSRKKSLGVLWCWWAAVLLSVTIILSVGLAEGKHAWERPGCHKVGKTD